MVGVVPVQPLVVFGSLAVYTDVVFFTINKCLVCLYGYVQQFYYMAVWPFGFVTVHARLLFEYVLCMSACLYGCLDICGHLTIWLCGHLVIWLHCCMAILL